LTQVGDPLAHRVECGLNCASAQREAGGGGTVSVSMGVGEDDRELVVVQLDRTEGWVQLEFVAELATICKDDVAGPIGFVGDGAVGGVESKAEVTDESISGRRWQSCQGRGKG